jgi:excinuclease ABC subunit C
VQFYRRKGAVDMTKQELYQKACMLPLLPGVYIIRDKTDTIIYIGKAKRLRIRVSQYFREGVPHDNKVSQMIAHAFTFDMIVCQSEFEALVLEASQIKAHTPKYNILLKDDKGYSYIRITKEEWPRLSFTLQKEDDGAEYLGPYTSSFAAREMAENAMDSFLLPRCGKRFPEDIGKGRPCLYAHIGKCMAVCGGKISCARYNEAVRDAVHLIRYGKKDILKNLTEKMNEAAERLDFETAALLRDQIRAIEKVSAGQKVVVDPDMEMDVCALAGTPESVCAAILRFRGGRLTDKREFVFHDTADIAEVREEFLSRYYLDDGEEKLPRVVAVDALPDDAAALHEVLEKRRGTKVQLYVPQRGDVARLVEMAHTNAVERLARESGRYAREEKMLDELGQLLGLPAPPQTIESYDISNWGDGSSVCGMVVFRDGKPYRAGYRKFRMQTVFGTDDYASMAETLARRCGEYEKFQAEAPGAANAFAQKPDLILLDGGRGQVSAVRAALAGRALADVPLFGMVKDDHHRTRAIVDDAGRETAINMNRGVFTFVTSIQDEVHRFANAYRKQQMHKKSYAVSLTQVPGVGPALAKALTDTFKSAAAVKNAAPEQLEKVPGVGPQLARAIFAYFHPAGGDA